MCKLIIFDSSHLQVLTMPRQGLQRFGKALTLLVTACVSPSHTAFLALKWHLCKMKTLRKLPQISCPYSQPHCEDRHEPHFPLIKGIILQKPDPQGY